MKGNTVKTVLSIVAALLSLTLMAIILFSQPRVREGSPFRLEPQGVTCVIVEGESGLVLDCLAEHDE